MKPVKIGYYVKYHDPKTGSRENVGKVISFDDETVVIWNGTFPYALPRICVLEGYENLMGHFEDADSDL